MAIRDDTSRKLHPWLRVIRNGDAIVNAVRADGSTRMACSVSTDADAGGTDVAPAYAEQAELSTPNTPLLEAAAPAPPKRLPKRAKLEEQPPATDAFVNVFIEFAPESRPGSDERIDAAIERVRELIASRSVKMQSTGDVPIGLPQTRRNFISATIPVSMLDELDSEPGIAFIHPAEPLKLDAPDVVPVNEQTIPSRNADLAKKFGRGDKVMIGIIDVGGFDFSHPEFLDDSGKTRIEAIWDQGGDFRKAPDGFTYGSEFTRAQLDRAIEGAKTPGLPPAQWIERQSQVQPGSHGTHVASIAAGRNGVCPDAVIAGVIIDVPDPGDTMQRRRATFSDTSRITDAVEYLLGLAERHKLPISINISLGTNGGSHDGASGVSRWLDALLATPGRAICVAAGNAGQEKAKDPTDLGFIMGRVHTSGVVAARGLEVELDWTVMGDGMEDISENEMEIWYGAQDRFSVGIKPPGPSEWYWVPPMRYIQNKRLADGVTFSIYNELYHTTNGANYIALYLSPNLDPKNFRGIKAGVWKVRLRGEEVRDGRFDAWIERDDPREIGREGGRRFFRFPSFFSERSLVDSHSITSLACGQRVIAVANLDDERQQIHATSSQGPTRDGRFKPEIAAPGTNIRAANGFGEPEQPYVAMTGTSMACPYVTGVVGLMLSNKPELTAAQIGGILQRTASPLAGGSYSWVNDVGFGRINAAAALGEALEINTRLEIK